MIWSYPYFRKHPYLPYIYNHEKSTKRRFICQSHAIHGMRVYSLPETILSVEEFWQEDGDGERFKVYSGWWFLIIIHVEMGWFNHPTSVIVVVLLLYLYLLYTQHVLLSHTHTHWCLNFLSPTNGTSSIAIGLGNPTLSFSCFLGTTGSKRKECIFDILPNPHFKSNHTLRTSLNIQKYTVAPERILLTRPKIRYTLNIQFR